MTHRARFHALLDYQPVDRLPVYFFSVWEETLARWQAEGVPDFLAIPGMTGMDPDWEWGMWNCHGLVNIWPISRAPEVVLEEAADWRVVRTPLGAINRVSTQGSSIPQHLAPALEPTRASWERFKGFLDPADPARRPAGWETAAAAVNQRDRVATFIAGSLYGWPREWLGVEQISYLMYDDPDLLEEMLDYLTEWFITLHRPVLERVSFDFAYFFEDCCGRSGPLFSPAIYRQHFHKYYVRLLDFYRGMGIRHFLLDSDGKVDDLVPCWLESGFDILFPIEVGTWGGDPRRFRQQYGKGLRMMGGVDKHVITQGEEAIRAHLTPLRSLVEDGGYLPLPDHRIPPSCSLAQFRTYIRVYREVFGVDA